MRAWASRRARGPWHDMAWHGLLVGYQSSQICSTILGEGPSVRSSVDCLAVLDKMTPEGLFFSQAKQFEEALSRE